MTYTAKNFRFTESGWVVDVQYDGAILDKSIPAYDINAQDCKNFDAVYRTNKRLPYVTDYGHVFPIVDNYEKLVNQVIRLTTPATTGDEADAVHDHIESAEILDMFGPQEPPQDYRIWNKRQPDGTFKPISQFFDEAAKNIDPRTPAQVEMDADLKDLQEQVAELRG